MRFHTFIYSAIIFLVCFSSCSPGKKASGSAVQSNAMVPGVIIYQTTRDYSKNVPVILSEDKKSIESYPGIKDVYIGEKLAYPTSLAKGFWLDNRGINQHVAFLTITYEEYAKLPQTPSAEELIKMVLDDSSLVCMYKGNARESYRDIVKDLNKKIKKGDFSGFEKMK